MSVGQQVRVKVRARDREHNLSELHLDWGDGSTPEQADAGTALRNTHTYRKPGTYKIKLTVLDFYLKRATRTITVTVRPAP